MKFDIDEWERKHLLEESASATPTSLRLKEIGETGSGVAGTGQRRKVTLIEAGWGSSGYYPREVLARDGPKVWPAGTHMYLDHPGVTEEHDRPERTLRDLVGVIATTPVMEGNELVAEAEVYSHWTEAIDAMAKDIGVSIRAMGDYEEGEADGRAGRIITALTEGISADYVTHAGAGGKVGMLIESARQKEAKSDAPNLREGTEARHCGNCDHFSEGTCELYDFQTDPADVCDSWKAVVAESRRKLEEARNVGEWLEAFIHSTFTQRVDSGFGEGYISRAERLALSGAIGEALDAFHKFVEENAPQLFERDPFDEPSAAEVPVEESWEKGVKESRSGGGKEPEMGDENKELSELKESVRELKEKDEQRESELKEERTKRERAEDALFTERARNVINEVLSAEPNEGEEGLPDLPERALDRVREAALGDSLPKTEAGELDKDRLKERVEKAVAAEAEYLGLVKSGSAVSGMGVSESANNNGGQEGEVDQTQLTEAEEKLAQTFQRQGMSESAAKTAAKGR